MWQIKIILLISLAGFISTLCDIEWVNFKDKTLVQTQGLSAGLYKKNVPAYIGIGKSSQGIFVPGRLEIENPKGLRYASNLAIQKTLTAVEFIRKSENHNYTWVSGSSLKCINNAVTVDDTFYIGRVQSGDFSYIGQVRIGESGIKYENSQGIQINGNEYEVLTCSMVSENVNYKENLTKCEAVKNELNIRVDNLKIEKKALSVSNSNSQEMLKLYKYNNVLLNNKVENIEEELKECYCTNNNVDKIIDESQCKLPRTTQKPCLDQSTTVQRLENEILSLETENNYLTTENKKVLKDFNEAKNLIKELNKEIETLKKPIENQPSGQEIWMF